MFERCVWTHVVFVSCRLCGRLPLGGVRWHGAERPGSVWHRLDIVPTGHSLFLEAAIQQLLFLLLSSWVGGLETSLSDWWRERDQSDLRSSWTAAPKNDSCSVLGQSTSAPGSVSISLSSVLSLITAGSLGCCLVVLCSPAPVKV